MRSSVTLTAEGTAICYEPASVVVVDKVDYELVPTNPLVHRRGNSVVIAFGFDVPESVLMQIDVKTAERLVSQLESLLQDIQRAKGE